MACDAAPQESGDPRTLDTADTGGAVTTHDTADTADTGDTTGPVDTADSAGADPQVDVEIPDWPDCPELTDPYVFTDLSSILEAYVQAEPDIVALIAGASYAESGGDGLCPTYDAFSFAFPDFGYTFAADGQWSWSVAGGVHEVHASGTTSTHVEGSTGYLGERTDLGGYVCADGLCADAGYVQFVDYEGLDGELCYAGSSRGLRWLGQAHLGVIRLIADHRIELRFTEAGNWMSVDGGAWAEVQWE